MKNRYLIRLLTILLLFVSSVVAAQKLAPPPYCAAPDLTDDQRRALDRRAKFALAAKRASNAAPTAITYVPIRPHVFRTSAGTGGIDLAKLNRIMAAANSYYLLNGYGIQFYFAGVVPDYIDNDNHATTYVTANENAIVAGRDVPNALNLYIVNGFETMGLGGYAYFPANTVSSTRSFVLNEPDESDLGNRLLPHEIGHSFGLFHTFQGNTTNIPELVTRGAGANCSTTGDLLCDTPADPYGRAGATTTYIDGCQQYVGTITDPQGATYSPALTNIMSYYFPCSHNFTEGQYDRMGAGLALRQSHTAYTLNYAPTAVTAPASLSARLSANGRFVSLTWQDRSTNEMGFFVERSARPDAGFQGIGGTGPNGTTFVDGGVTAQVTYYYRVRPSNTTTGSLSPVVSVDVPICRPTFSSACSVTNGLARVTVNGTTLSTNSGCASSGYSSTTAPAATVGAGAVVPLTATLLNPNVGLRTAVWLDLNRNSLFEADEQMATTDNSSGPVSLSVALPASLTAGPLGLRLIAVTGAIAPADPCGAYAGGEAEDYLLTVASPATCATPTGLSVTGLTNASARLNWSVPATGAPPLFAAQYRRSGAANWITLNSLAGTSVQLTDLFPGQPYEWQVLGVCGTSGSSPLSVIGTFETTCVQPTGLTTAPIYRNVAQLNWAGTAGTTYALQWRAVGGSWNTVPTVTALTYALTGLTAESAYEWRVAIHCAAGLSAYSEAVGFTASGELYYCRPVSSDGCSEDDGLSGLTIGSEVLSTDSGCSPGGYGSFTTVSTTLNPGQAYSFTATLLSASWEEGLVMWVDLDKNGSFELSEQVYTSPMTSSLAISGSVTLPSGTLPGLYTLRARVAYNQIPTDPCGAINFGETEDYVIWVANPACGSATATLTGSQAITSGQTATLTVGLTGAAPWSLTLSNGSSASGLTSSPGTFTVNPTVTTTYTVTRVSNECGTGVSSGTAVVTVNVPCHAPTELSAVASVTAVTFFWTAAANATGYVLWFRRVGTSPWTSQTATATSATYSFTAPVFGQAFEWQIQSACAGGGSVFSPTARFTIPSAADLSLAMAVNRRVPAINELVTFTGEVYNEGPQQADGVVVMSLLPPNMRFGGSVESGVTSSGGAVSVVMGTLPVGTSGLFSFSASVSQPGTYRTAAQVTAASVADTDSYLNSGTMDGDDDAVVIDLRTREPASAVFASPNPGGRVLPPVQDNQPPPGAQEADLSLSLQVGDRLPVAGSVLSLSVTVANRGALTATGIGVAVTLPAGWAVTNTAGLSVAGQVVTVAVANLSAGQLATIIVPVRVAGAGEQPVRAVITAANQPDADSAHGNGYGLGEDDEATVTVRVR